MPGKRLRRYLRVVLVVLLLLLATILATPLWFPWLLRPMAKRFGVTFQDYHRVSYTEFVVTGAFYSNRNVLVQAGRMLIAPKRNYAEAENWSVVVTPSRPQSSTSSASTHRVYTQVSKVVSNVQHWVPEAKLTNGYVKAPKVTIDIPGAAWKGSIVSGQAKISNALPLTIVHAKLDPGGPIQVALLNTGLELKVDLVASNTLGGISLAATNRWRTNDFSLFAEFGTNGVLPQFAKLTGRGIVFPPVRGDLALVWEQNRYALDAQGVTIDQPIAFTARLNGDMTSAHLEAAKVTSPWAAATIEGDVAFSRSNVTHHGAAIIQNVNLPRMNGFDVGVDWRGENLNLKEVHATARAGSNTVTLNGTADLNRKEVHIAAVELGTNLLGMTARLRWPAEAAVCAQLTNVSSASISEFVNLQHNPFVFDHLWVLGGWTNGPIVGDVDFRGGTAMKDGTSVGAEGAAAVRLNGVTLTNLTFTRNAVPVSSAYGLIPISIVATNKPMIAPIPNGALEFQVNADAKAFFWDIFQTNYGVSLREPELRAEVHGTWSKPLGRVQARAAEIKFRNAPPEVPSIESLALVAHIREEAAELEFLNFFVTNQPVTFSALMSVPAGFWNSPRTNVSKLDWRDLSCRLKIHDAQIAAFAPLIPRIVAPQGIIDADVGLKRGGKLDGQLRIDGAGTRPIESLGALQDIEIICRFSGNKADVNSYVALGGYSVLGAGEVQLDPNQLLRAELPPFQFNVTGENVPLTRQGDAIVRADMDLTLKHATNVPVTLGGRLNLRDSLYLRELRDLIPGKLASTDRRPPYFSIAAKPFREWRLDVRAAGQRFLKVRTPVFNGVISTDVKLSGTLGEPVAVGDVIINSGLARFPFGNIPINQGIISLTSDNPYRPQLLLTGNDRVLGYDVNMELTGYADAPVLQFSSTPPLNSDQVLLMLTAGEIPRQGQINFTTQQRAQRLAVFLGRGLLSDLGVGGDSNRLTVRSGENVSDSGRPTYSAEYELTEDWSVIGQYDRFNDFNLMLKWRVYSK